MPASGYRESCGPRPSKRPRALRGGGRDAGCGSGIVEGLLVELLLILSIRELILIVSKLRGSTSAEDEGLSELVVRRRAGWGGSVAARGMGRGSTQALVAHLLVDSAHSRRQQRTPSASMASLLAKNTDH